MVPGTYVLKPNVDLFMKLEQLSNLPMGILSLLLMLIGITWEDIAE